MSSYNEVVGALKAYRNELQNQIQDEASILRRQECLRLRGLGGSHGAFSTILTNIHATGIGIRLKNNKVVENDYVIKIYVFDKRKLGNRTPSITRHFGGVSLDVEYLPIQLALAKQNGTSDLRHIKSFNPTSISEHRVKQRPITGGTSISAISQASVGTLGCFLQASSEGTTQIYALSNNHVLADCNRLPPGTMSVQPGAEIGPTSISNAFGSLSKIIQLKFASREPSSDVNKYDAAISTVDDATVIAPSLILGVERYVPKVGVAVPGMKVIKSGRTTGVTTGTITGTLVNDVQVNYGTIASPLIALYDESIRVTSDNEKPFSLPGDSGAVILDLASGQPVALLYAGDGSGSTACDLMGICKFFKAFPI